MADEDLRETVIGSEILHRGRLGNFRIDTVRFSDGRTSTREILGHPGAVAIVAIDPDGSVLFVRQWRTAAGRAMLEIPAGTLDLVDAAVARATRAGAAAAPAAIHRSARCLGDDRGHRGRGCQLEPDATRIDRLSYLQVLERGLKVMDATAISLCMDNRLPIVVFNLRTPGNIKRAVTGESIGSLVTA